MQKAMWRSFGSGGLLKNSEVGFVIVSVLAWGPILPNIGTTLGLSGIVENAALLVALIPVSLAFPLLVITLLKRLRA